MIYDRYYYSILSQDDKKFYKRIYDGIEQYEPCINITGWKLSAADINTILLYINLDNPHLFYVDFSAFQYSNNLIGISILLTYWYTADEVKELNGKIEKVLNRMLAKISRQSEYEIEKSIHDLLIGNILYDTKALENLHRKSPRSNTILGVLFYKEAVCEGIAKVTKMLLNMLDIKCIVAYGSDLTENEPHAWNIVKLNGKPYHLDITWDLGLSGNGVVVYDYFNLTDADILADHRPDIKYPVCSSTESNYFVLNDLVVSNSLQAEKALVKAKLSGMKYVSLKIKCERTLFRSCMNKVIDAAVKCNVISGNTCSYSFNQEQQTVSFSIL